MIIDLSVKITKSMAGDTNSHGSGAPAGHIGTHFDVMDRSFPLDYAERQGIIFDVSDVGEREIEASDIQLSAVEEGMFVAFYSGHLEKTGYGTKAYFTNHPHLSNALIDALLDKKIAIIGVDFVGIRRGSEHTPKDQYCADHGVFVVENLCNLAQVLQGKQINTFHAHTYPIHYEGWTGLPCRVMATI